MKNHSSQDTTLDISIIGLMSALVFVGTYFFKFLPPLATPTSVTA